LIVRKILGPIAGVLARTAPSNSLPTSTKPSYHKNNRHRDNTANMSLVTGEKSNFQFILRLLNTNVDGQSTITAAPVVEQNPV
jgi:hypothetical protein